MSAAHPSREDVYKMFDAISPTYDQINRVMTFNLDKRWRKKVAKCLPEGKDLRVLDCATGTGDQLFAVMEHASSVTSAVGVDLSENMLLKAKEKLARKPYVDRVSFQVASALSLPFHDDSCDCVTISFGIRNVTDPQNALVEFKRVLKPGGRLVILEGSVPQNKLVRAGHQFYMRHVMPRIGAFISRAPQAYRYLNQTIETFASGEAFCSIMSNAGFVNVRATPLNLGSVTIYQGDKA